MSDTAWHALDEELDRWASVGETVDLWLRDDDAIEATAALDRLLLLTEEAQVPLNLAVIPTLAKPSLADRLTRASQVSVLQHGFAHANHAPLGAKKSELADQRSLEEMTEELVQGRTALFAMFGDLAEPVLVPPWNRIADVLPTVLAACGLHGLSRFKPRKAKEAASGLTESNAHVDLIDWRAGRVGKPVSVILDEIKQHLTARRLGDADRNEPTGLLTHHLVMDAPAWHALSSIFDKLLGDRRVTWQGAPEIFESVK